jgi:aryl carrier-like protein
LCPAPADIALAGMPLLDIIRGEALTMVGLPPSALTAFMDEDLSNIRTLIAAGEACSAELAAHWSKGRRLWNAYGPTETTICATLATDWDPRRAPPIGRPIANTQCYVLDRFLQPAPLGVAGELYIGGEGVTRGYLDQPDLTAAVFLPDPFGGRMGARMYKSGDLVRWRAEGSLEFLGRVDQQVKIRGFRIELGEIEAALRRHPSIDECVVIAREDSPGMKRLAAYIVSCQPGLDPAALRAFLHERLPEYMVPAAIVFLPALPLMDQGKVDRKALPNPDLLTGANEDSHVAPRTANEQLLAGIWAEILHRERIGVHDNFFEIGGDSIKSIQVIARANRAGLTLTAKDLFQHQSVAELAAAAERSRSTVEGAPEFDRASEWEFWRTVLSHDDVPLPVEGAAMDNERVTHHPPPLDERLTRILLDAANSEHGDETIDFLLTALAQALYAWTGERAWLVEVQSRVARQPDSEKDDERVIYPMRVEISEGSTSLESLQEIRSRRRAMPSGGRHFMKLWNSGDSTIQAALRAMPAPRIRIAVDSDRASSPRVSVPWNGSPLYALDIGVRISSDGMRADWNYTSGEFQPGTIELVATTYVDRLQTLLRDWDTERMTKAIPEDDRARLLAQFESSGDGEEAR